MNDGTADKTTALNKRHRTTPLPESLTSVPGYPKKLTLYLLEASSYWWVRYYTDGKIVRRSTKTEDKNKAYKFAKEFYDNVNLRRVQGLAVTSKSRFVVLATAMLKAQQAEVARGEVTQDTYSIANYRLTKSVLPFFGEHDVAEVNYELLEKYLHELSMQQPKLSLSTISSYMKLVRKVLGYAYKRQLIMAIPHFPAVAAQDNPRGYFNTREYRLLYSRAKALTGKRFDLLKQKNKQGEEGKAFYAEAGKTAGRKVRTIEIGDSLNELIVFMVNSFIRPTDIKNIQHKHVEIIRGDDNTYLRLSLPTSKKHAAPIVTMRMAVDVYERLTANNKAKGLGVGPDDYLFLPQYQKRDYALKQLQRQFDVLMWSTKLDKGARGEDRTIYSLRHTCIMYRLLYGEKMDHVTLARNARTSPEMIDRFYASHLKGEDNIDMLQSRRRRKAK
ncbi:MAG: phage integrase SAM-like domain-containing protein [Thiobacillus sp.]